MNRLFIFAKRAAFAAAMLLTTLATKAQDITLDWAKHVSGPEGSGFGSSIAVDAAGNVYTTGAFQGTVDFDPGAGTFELTSAGQDDIFISKLAPNGDFLWARQIGGSSYDQGVAIGVDVSGNVYTMGTFQGTVDFDPGEGTHNLTSAGPLEDIFISKLNTSGQFVWARQLSGSSTYSGSSMTVDAAGNVYTTGYFRETIDFDPGDGVYNLTSIGLADIFISKLNTNGNFVWAKRMGGSNSEEGLAITVDGSGNVYTTGFFRETVDFDPGEGTYELTSSIGLDVFISKLDNDGDFVWAKQFSVSTSGFGNAIAVDAAGNVYTTGYFFNTADFDPGEGTYELTAAGDEDIFISKLDVNGNFVWAKRIGGSSSLGARDRGYGIALDGSGNVYTTGYFQGNIDFDPGAGTHNLAAAGQEDVFVSKLASNGDFVWAKRIGGAARDYGSAIAVTGSGNVYTTGLFYETADFDPGEEIYNLTASGLNFDIFISGLTATGDFAWAKRMGGSAGDGGSSIAVDAAGNVYTTGYFVGTVDFDPGDGTHNLTSAGGNDIFISKSDANGGFLWAKRIGGTSSDYGYAIAVDGSGNVYTTGYFYGTVDFDPGDGTHNLTSAGGNDIFVSKLTTNGDFVWARRIGGALSDGALAIAVDGSGSVYTTGSFRGTVDFDPGAGTFELTSAGQDDIFISKLTTDGNFVWAKRIGGTLADQAFGIAVDGSGNVYTTGTFRGTADFNPGTGAFELTSAGGTDIFISKLAANGDFAWAKSIGGVSTLGDGGRAIAVDGSGNVYTTGYFRGTVDFDPGEETYNLVTANTSTDIFISKLTTAGDFVWAKRIGGTQACQGFSIALDGFGNVYTTGYFRGTNVDFDPGNEVYNLTTTPFGSDNTFILRLTAGGNFVWAKHIGGSSGDEGLAIAVDASGNVHATGSFLGTVDFDPGEDEYNLASPSYSIFVVKLNPIGGLPVTLAGFTVRSEGNVAMLQWTTTEEVNASHFEIESSVDGRNFVAVGSVPARGGSRRETDDHGTMKRYTFADPLTVYSHQSMLYYRLRMVDLDGTFDYSEIRSIRLDAVAKRGFYPNPVSNGVLHVPARYATGQAEVSIYNLAGRQVYRHSGIKAWHQLSGLATGLYLVEINDGKGNVLREKVIIK